MQPAAPASATLTGGALAFRPKAATRAMHRIIREAVQSGYEK